MPLLHNPYKVRKEQKPMSVAEYQRHLIAVAQKLREGTPIVTREAALFTGLNVMYFLQVYITSPRGKPKVKPMRQYDRYLIDKRWFMAHIVDKPKSGRGNFGCRPWRKNVYTGLPMGDRRIQKAIDTAISYL